MKSIIILFVCKILSFLGATLNTVGFFTFFFWESLAPHRWQMIVGGITLIVLSEVAVHFLGKRMAEEDPFQEEIEN